MFKKKRPTHTIAGAMKSIERKRRDRERSKAEVASRVSGEGYESCIVSFIDILGFRSLVETRHANEIRDIILFLREYTQPDSFSLRGVDESRLQSRSFVDSVSDAVVRVRVFETQYSDGAFYQELLDILHAQIQCIHAGVLIRAGMSVGKAHVGIDGKGPVFGPAMIKSYEIESTHAIHPRVVIDEAAYKSFLNDPRLRSSDHTLSEEKEYVDRLIAVDENNARYIDYLRASESEFDNFSDYANFINVHSNIIKKGLSSFVGKVKEKYLWLKTYHNDVVNEIVYDFANGDRSSSAFVDEYDADPITVFEQMIVV